MEIPMQREVDTEGFRQTYWPARCAIVELPHQVVTRPKQAAPEDPNLMASEIRALGDDQRVFTDGDYQVYAARRYQVPSVVREIGRLRELSQRSVGDGTGLSRDLDHLDDRAMHLFVWDAAAREVTGASRFFMTDLVLACHGVEGLSVSEFFDFAPGFFDRLGPALEVGCSFVRPERQQPERIRAALLLGLFGFAAERPQYRNMLSLGTLPRRCRQSVRGLLAETLLSGPFRHELSALVRPKFSMAKAPLRCFPLATQAATLAAQVVAAEPDGSGLNAWVRQGLGLNGKFMGFGRGPSRGDSAVGVFTVRLPQAETPSVRGTGR